jgi:hypothetical protein
MKNQLIEVPFRASTINTIQVNGVIHVAMRPICEDIGLDWAAQTVKLNKVRMRFNCCEITTVASDGRLRSLLCIPLRKLNGWLFSVNPEKVRPEIRDNLIAYQEECFGVLYDHFNKSKIPSIPSPARYPCRILHTFNEHGVIIGARIAEPDEDLTSPKNFAETLKKRGYALVRIEEFAGIIA